LPADVALKEKIRWINKRVWSNQWK